MKHEQYILSQGGKEVGLAWADIEEYLLTPQKFKEFQEFMRGQTSSVVGGILIVYTHDYLRFIEGLPVID
jgi:hypothetical protein